MTTTPLSLAPSQARCWRRRGVLAAALAGCAAALGGCAGSSPPVYWYALRADPPEPPPPSLPAGTADDVWELGGVGVPGELERDTVVLASGAAMLQPLAGHRWAEPLRDSVPRLLAADLARLRGAGRVWVAPAPAGVAVARRLRIELGALVAAADRHSVRVQARWWFADARAGGSFEPAAPVVASADFEVPIGAGDASVDAIAAAHRLALWRLAARIAATP